MCKSNYGKFGGTKQIILLGANKTKYFRPQLYDFKLTALKECFKTASMYVHMYTNPITLSHYNWNSIIFLNRHQGRFLKSWKIYWVVMAVSCLRNHRLLKVFKQIDLHLFLPLSLPLMRLVPPHPGSQFLSFFFLLFSFLVSSSFFLPSFSSLFLLPPSASNPLLLLSRLPLQRWLGAKDGPR